MWTMVVRYESSGRNAALLGRACARSPRAYRVVMISLKASRGTTKAGWEPMSTTQVVHSHPEIMSGTPVFVGTRVPVQALVDFLEEGDTIDSFLDSFPTVTREQAVAFIEQAAQLFLANVPQAA